jgi:hypothetical protein
MEISNRDRYESAICEYSQNGTEDKTSVCVGGCGVKNQIWDLTNKSWNIDHSTVNNTLIH